MIRTLLGRTLWHQRRLIVSAVLGLVAFEILLIQIAAAFEAGPGLGQIMDMLPPLLKSFVESQMGGVTDLSLPSFLAFSFQHPAVMVLTVSFAVLAATAPAGERETELLDLILARPVPRRAYLAAVVLDLALIAVLLPTSLLVGGWAGLRLVDVPGELPWSDYIGSAAGFAALLLALGGLALLAAVESPRRGVAVARIVGVLLPLYVVDVFGDLYAPLRSFRWLSPFHYYDPVSDTLRGQDPLQGFVVLLGVFVVTTAVAVVRFRRRDL